MKGQLLGIFLVLVIPSLVHGGVKSCKDDTKPDTCGPLASDVITKSGVSADCVNAGKGMKKGDYVCAVVFFMGGDNMAMATNPSCDKCTTRNTQEAMDLCNKYKDKYNADESREPWMGKKVCYTFATPYTCFDEKDHAFITCAVQANYC